MLDSILQCGALTFFHSRCGDRRGDKGFENDLIWFLTAERYNFFGRISSLSNQSHVPECTYHLSI